MDGTSWLHLPDTWGALWPIVSNPGTAGIVITIAMEQWGWIKNKDVPNIRKLGAVFLACLAWAIFRVLMDPNAVVTWENLKSVIYTIAILAVGVTAMSQIGYGLIQQIPWLKDILSALFGNTTIKAAKLITLQQGETGITGSVASYTSESPSAATGRMVAKTLDDFTRPDNDQSKVNPADITLEEAVEKVKPPEG